MVGSCFIFGEVQIYYYLKKLISSIYLINLLTYKKLYITDVYHLMNLEKTVHHETTTTVYAMNLSMTYKSFLLFVIRTFDIRPTDLANF